jgi:signal transduction histidine kinase
VSTSDAFRHAPVTVRAGGTGLRGIADRVSAVGGHLTVTDLEGAGTSITADFPIPPRAVPPTP